jgi:hypothetical protein
MYSVVWKGLFAVALMGVVAQSAFVANNVMQPVEAASR